MKTPSGIYIDDGRRITTHSMLKAFGRCPNQARYKYAERLKPKYVNEGDKPLRRGTWFHALLEEHYAGRSWQERHRELCRDFSLLFDEEKDHLGDLPAEMLALMRSYLWHYGADKSDPLHGWEVKGTELTMECAWPDSKDGKDVYRCRLDMMMHDPLWGLLIGDHKTHKTLPNTGFRLLDAASALYIWCAWENGYDVQGFLWNYIRTKAPTEPKLVYVGKKNEGLSKSVTDTDYPTMVRAIKKYGLDPAPYRDRLRFLKSQRWEAGAVQTSGFFRRDVLEKDEDMIRRVVAAAMLTRDRMHAYDWKAVDAIERVPDRFCGSMCRSYVDLCQTELYGGDGKRLRRQLYKIGDPLDYYHDQRESTEV